MRNMALSLILISSCMCTYASSDDTESLLYYLQSQLKEVRSATSDKASEIEKIPDVSSLAGMRIDKLSQWLGDPGSDTGEYVTYVFYRLPITYVGGGPVLIIDYDGNGIITNAKWMVTE